MTHLPFVEYDRSNISYARHNRMNPTFAEKIVREKVLRKKKTGYKFTRQKLLGPFIVDFYCAELGLAIELDGSSHDDKYVEGCHRTDILNDFGVEVLRFDNSVVDSLDDFQRDLKSLLKQKEKLKALLF